MNELTDKITLVGAAGLPQEDDIMLGEVTDLTNRLQPILTLISAQSALAQSDAWCDSGAAEKHHRRVAAAGLWAMCCLEQCSRPDPAGTGFVLADGISAMPQVCTLSMLLQHICITLEKAMC